MNVHTDFQLLKYNTLGISSTAAQFVELSSSDDYLELLSSGLLSVTPFFVLGGGSNVVLPERYEGIVIHPVVKGIKLLDEQNGVCHIEVSAGEVWADFVDHCIEHGWYGLENMAGIPGSVGASPVQNVGAYGREAKDFIERVHCYDIATGVERWIESDECQFDYRWSRFKGEWKKRFLVDRVVFRLKTTDTPDVSYKALADRLSSIGVVSPSAKDISAAVKYVRDSKLPDPRIIGSVGSFFKNPIVDSKVCERIRKDHPDIVTYYVSEGRFKIGAGWMIDKCGLRGYSDGRVGVYEKQALVLVNKGGCTAMDVSRFAQRVVNEVYAKFGVRLEYEAIFV